jgi:hypothetical protein
MLSCVGIVTPSLNRGAGARRRVGQEYLQNRSGECLMTSIASSFRAYSLEDSRPCRKWGGGRIWRFTWPRTSSDCWRVALNSFPHQSRKGPVAQLESGDLYIRSACLRWDTCGLWQLTQFAVACGQVSRGSPFPQHRLRSSRIGLKTHAGNIDRFV